MERAITVEFDYADDQREHFSEDVRLESPKDLLRIRAILRRAESRGTIAPDWYCGDRQSEATPSGRFLRDLKAAVS